MRNRWLARTALALAVLLFSGCVAQDPASSSNEGTVGGLATKVVPVDESDGDAFEPMVAVDPSDPDHLVIAASEHRQDENGQRHRWNVAYTSFDGGASWTRTELAGGMSAGPSHPLFTATDMGDGVAAILPDGSVLYSGLALNLMEANGGAAMLLTAYTVYVYRSSDGGLTFDDLSVIETGRGVVLVAAGVQAPVAWHANDKNWLTVGPDGTALLGWTEIEFPPIDSPGDIGQNDAVFSASTDGGRTWSAPGLIAEGGYSGSYPAITRDGTWYMALLSFGQGKLHLATSTDQGASWDLTTVTTDGAIPVTWPTLTAQPMPDGHDRLLYGYTAQDGSDQRDGVLLASDDGGATWSEHWRVDSVGELTWPQHSFSVDGDGVLYMIGYDQSDGRDDPSMMVAAFDGGAQHVLELEAGLAGNVGLRGHYLGLAGLPQGAVGVYINGEPGDYHLASVRLTWA